MTINYPMYHATMKKIQEAAEANVSEMLQKNDYTVKHFGDENATKIRRHNGSIVYYLTAEVVDELLKWCLLQENVLEMLCNNSPAFQELTKKEKSCIAYIASNKPESKYLESLRKAVNGDYMLDFYRDEEALANEKRYSEAKQELYSTKWGF